jgi:hypothetical protein
MVNTGVNRAIDGDLLHHEATGRAVGARSHPADFRMVNFSNERR